MEPGGGAGGMLAAGARANAGVRRTLPPAHPSAGREPVAGGGAGDRSAAGPQRPRSGHGELLRRDAPPPVVAESRTGRGIPDRPPQTRRRPPPVPPYRGSPHPEGRLGAVPLVPRRARRSEVVPGDT